ncbi:outer membrane beta-barrel family protein [Hoylesella loescheii]|uniref:outer membrane beta-barrel family protein n=1 Tax=Hoylesella loescheii TaxID=840 RepID=UPI0028EA1D69|nr:outer membrane beta-barrel family protein [Hoylesella loescheii]
MKTLNTYLLLMFLCLSVYVEKAEAQQTLTLLVSDSLSGEPLTFVNIKVKSAKDSLICYSDSIGKCVIPLQAGNYELLFSNVGYINHKENIALDTDKTLHIKLSANAKVLGEVSVVGRKRLIKITHNGLEYDLLKDLAAQSTNLLAALNRVPLVNVDANDNITVKGSTSFSIFLNGHPYRIAQSSPKSVLQSIPVTTVKKIEIIDRINARYGGDVGDAIINIVTNQQLFDNYALTLNGEANTQPRANAGLNLMGTHKDIDYSVGYNYALDGQRKQPIASKSRYAQGSQWQEYNGEGAGDGDWKKHIVRAMLQWRLDTLNTLYLDGHALIEQTNLNTLWQQTFNEQEQAPLLSTFDTENKNTAGTAEANVIYRNLFRNTGDEHWVIGYRYTYNPDVRHYYQTNSNLLGNERRTKRKTNGGLHEHSLSVDLNLLNNDNTTLLVGGKQILRNGNIQSSHRLLKDGEWIDDAAESLQQQQLKYSQNVSAAYASISLGVGNFTLDASLRWEYGDLKMQYPQQTGYNFTNRKHYILPYASIYYQVKSSSLSLNYNTGVMRPSILMLNPFKAILSQYLAAEGNPQLKDAYTHTLETSYSLYSNKLFISYSLHYKWINHPIMAFPRYNVDKKQLITQYQNIVFSRDFGSNLYFNYRPIPLLSLTFSGNIDWYKNQESEQLWDKSNIAHNLTLMCDVFLKKNWTIALQYGNYKNPAEIWAKSHAFSISSLAISKSFFKGSLNTRVVMNSPFQKYNELLVEQHLTHFSRSQTNYLTARAFGIDITYTFKSGSPKELKRDSRLKSSDQKTGVE